MGRRGNRKGKLRINEEGIGKAGNKTGSDSYGEHQHGEKRCDVCTLPHATEDCPLISTGVRVEDAVLPKKAYLTLPSSLDTEDLNGKQDVVSKYGLAKGTQFGPLDAPKSSKFNALCPYMLKIFKGNQVVHFLDTTDQDKCNWMSLVRFTGDQKARNCICYQLKNEIYFSVVEDIAPGQALVLAYSPGYSAQLDKNQQSGFHLTGTSKSKSKEASKARHKKLSKSQGKISRSENQETFDIKPPINEIKIEPGARTVTETNNQEHFDHDYVAPTFGKQNLIQDESANDSTVQRRSTRKRKTPIDPHFEFGKRVRTDAKSALDCLQSDEDEEYEITIAEESILEKTTKRKGKRLYAVRALESWTCKFCRKAIPNMESFAHHLTEHYKKVGAARTEKGRIQKLDLRNEQVVKQELNPKVLLVRLKEPIATNEENSLLNTDESIDDKEHQKQDDGEKEEVEDIKINIEPSYPYECDICVKQKFFNRAEYLIRHLRNHSGELVCNECNEKFLTKEEQTIHTCPLNVRKEDGYACTLCDKIYCSNSNLRQHLRIRHGKSFKCNKCRRLFNTDEGLQNHDCKPKKPKSDNDITIMHKCEVCEATFCKSAAFEKHLTTHDKSSFTCTVCSKILSNETLKIHIAVCEVLQKFLDRETDDLKCPVHKCEKKFGDLQDFKDHVASHTHPFMCPSCNIRLKIADEIHLHSCGKLSCDSSECDRTFSSLNELKVHIAETHGGPKSYCFECAFPFVTAEGYVKHGDCELRRSTDLKDKPPGAFSKSAKQKGDGMFICEVCGAFYTKWSSMKTHRHTHGPKRFACEKCGKSFHRKELLADHVFVHEEAQFPCTRCEKKFKSKKSLEVHIRIHDNIKPYKCLACGRSFTQKVNLRSHELTHLPDDEKGFACPVDGCAKIFFSKEYLKFHIEAHEKGKHYTCDVCDKQFVRAHMLNQHKRMSHGNHKFKCEFCNPVLFLRQKHSLFRHLRKRHSDYQQVWGQDGYADTMFIPGDGNYTHPSLKNRMPRDFQKPEQNSSSDEEADGDIHRHADIADMTVMISGSMEDGTEEIEIEAQEVELEEEDAPGEMSHQNMVLLQLDNSGRYVIAFPNHMQKSEGSDEEQEYVMEEIGAFE